MKAEEQQRLARRDILFEAIAWLGLGLVFFGTWYEISLAAAGIVLGVFLLATAISANKK